LLESSKYDIIIKKLTEAECQKQNMIRKPRSIAKKDVIIKTYPVVGVEKKD